MTEEVVIESYTTTRYTPPDKDANGVEYTHVGCDGACTKEYEGGCAYFDGEAIHKVQINGYCTSNMAEYIGLVSLLEKLSSLEDKKKYLILMDSELVVKQINGSYRVRDEKLIPLYDKAIALLSTMDARLMWVPRANPLMRQIDEAAKKAARDGR